MDEAIEDVFSLVLKFRIILWVNKGILGKSESKGQCQIIQF
jgi:hypothetical protein